MSFLAFRTGLCTRPLRLGLSREYHPAHPSSWMQKIWYRPDGTRRSKIKGAIYVTAVSTAMLIYRKASILQTSQPVFIFIAKLQQVDSKHPIDESSTYADVAAYIVALGDIFHLLNPNLKPGEMAQLAETHKTISKFVPEHNENVRKIFHDMHTVFASSDQPVTRETAQQVSKLLERFAVEIRKMSEILVTVERQLSEEAGSDEKN